MKPTSLLCRMVWSGLLLAVVAVWAAAPATAEPDPTVRRSRRSGFNLRSAPILVLQVNRVQCGLDNIGNTCTDVFGSPTGGGGFWPAGSSNQYIFNAGLQVAGVVADGPWAGDTVGALFFDATGQLPHGEGVTEIFNSLDAGDMEAWPSGAYVRDASIYDENLLGRKSVSQQDAWVRYWDGNPLLLAGRSHPAGIMVEARSLAWNFPSGNEDIIYIAFTFYNVTASARATYDRLDCTDRVDASTGELAVNCNAIRDELAQIGQDYQDGVQRRLNVSLPSDGYTISDLYSAFAMDPDVTLDAGTNASTAILPFNMAVAYKTDFLDPTWFYPPEINGPPFGPYPGFIGVKYLQSPVNPATSQELGLTLFSNTTNRGAFPDPQNVSQLWRYLSGNIDAGQGDPTCTFPNPIQRRLCALIQEPADTRFFQASGPFALRAGESATIVVAFVHAAPLLAEILPYIDGQLAPGTPPTGAEIAASPSLLRVIERATGWAGQNDASGDNVIQESEVQTVPRSLLNKALVAQDLFNAKFLLPFAPEAPEFFLVPADGQVTVVWRPSISEEVPDPYYTIASNPASNLYDPNYRDFDVEGYRVYRGRTRAQLEMIAQFDYAGTVFTDRTGAFDYGNRCAPELGIQGDIGEPGAGCPVDFLAGETYDHDVVGGFGFSSPVQVLEGGRVELADGSVLVTGAVDAIEDAGFPALTNSGVPFAYIDREVLNSVTYYYAVAAFDINSVKSTSTSAVTLESPLAARAVTPRANPAGAAAVFEIVQVDQSGAVVPAADFPTMDAATGTFSGNMPPVQASMSLSAAAELLALDTTEARIDAVTAGYPFGGLPNEIVVTLEGDTTLTVTSTYDQPEHSPDILIEAGAPVAKYDDALQARFGINFSGPARGQVNFVIPFTGFEFFAHGSAVAAGRFGDVDPPTGMLLKSRWFDDGGQEPPDPTIEMLADDAHHAGTLTGVGRIFTPEAYRVPDAVVSQTFRGMQYHGATMFRSADFVVEWGSGGSVTITDVSNGVNVGFDPEFNAGYGFISPAAFVAAGQTGADLDCGGSTDVNLVSYRHFYAIGALADFWCEITKAPLVEDAVLVSLDFDADGTEDGTGVAFILNGQPWMMEMSELPASGTRWHLRAPAGELTATCTPDLVMETSFTDCGDYEWTPGAGVLQAPIPGLTYQIRVSSSYEVDPALADLSNVHTVPDPYYVTNSLEVTPTQKVIRFVNLPSQAIIRIYSLSGVLVDVIEHSDATGGGEATWDVRNRNNQFVASGVYFWHVETPDGSTRVGRFTVVNQGGLLVIQ